MLDVKASLRQDVAWVVGTWTTLAFGDPEDGPALVGITELPVFAELWLKEPWS